ncbi:Mechanosensitive ion channel protein 1, mitochondrial-like protein, partial [Drosera capensis]
MVNSDNNDGEIVDEQGRAEKSGALKRANWIQLMSAPPKKNDVGSSEKKPDGKSEKKPMSRRTKRLEISLDARELAWEKKKMAFIPERQKGMRRGKAGAVEGQVVEMGLTTTSLLSDEKFPVIVPNLLFSSQVIVNKSQAPWRGFVSKIPLRFDNLEKIPQVLDKPSLVRLVQLPLDTIISHSHSRLFTILIKHRLPKSHSYMLINHDFMWSRVINR